MVREESGDTTDGRIPSQRWPGRSAVRFRDEGPGDLDRVRRAVRGWRERHPQGTAGDLVADIGSEYHPDYAPVLRGVLHAVDMRRARTVTSIPGITENGQ